MTARQWKPGTVAMVTDPTGDVRPMIHIGHDPASSCWHGAELDGDLRCLDAGQALDVRPLVVIDPEDREQVERLIVAYSSQPRWHTGYTRDRIDAMQAALREFANPTPVKPTDPTARVTDRRENVWRLLADGEWVCTSGPDIGEYLVWRQLAAERGPLAVEVTP